MNYIHLPLGRSQTGLYAEPGKNSFKFGSICLNLGISISRGRSVLTYVPIQIYRSVVDLYSLMYLYYSCTKKTGQGHSCTPVCTCTYNYTGQGQICTHLCTCTIPVQIYRSGVQLYSRMNLHLQLYRSRVDLYSLMYLYYSCTIIQVKGRSVLTYVPVNSCTIIQVRGGSVLTFVSVQFTMCVDFFKGTFFIQREQESSKNFVDIFFIIGFKCYYGFCHFHLNKF